MLSSLARRAVTRAVRATSTRQSILTAPNKYLNTAPQQYSSFIRGPSAALPSVASTQHQHTGLRRFASEGNADEYETEYYYYTEEEGGLTAGEEDEESTLGEMSVSEEEEDTILDVELSDDGLEEGSGSENEAGQSVLDTLTPDEARELSPETLEALASLETSLPATSGGSGTAATTSAATTAIPSRSSVTIEADEGDGEDGYISDSDVVKDMYDTDPLTGTRMRKDESLPDHMQRMTLDDIRAAREGPDYAMARVSATLNNTIISFTTREGNILATVSGGSVGYKGAAKRGELPATEAALKIGTRMWDRKIRYLDIMIKGVGQGAVPVLNQLGALGFRVLSIGNVTPKPYNGTRKRKARR